MFWKEFKKQKPSKSGWYQCTVEVPNQQRYVMNLYWWNDKQKFINNSSQMVFDIYKVLNIMDERMYTDSSCDRTEDVIAWKNIAKPFVKGFKKEKWY